jgi:uncharacterized RDD family membrane protein YckC
LINSNKVNNDLNFTPNVKICSVRPWLRCFARFVDLALFSFAITLLLSFTVPRLLDMPDALYGMLALFLWAFVEAVMLATAGTTIGKWFFDIEIKTIDGAKPSFAKALRRSFAVWFYGCGAGIPIIGFVAIVVAFLDLDKGGVATWDDGVFTLSPAPETRCNGYGKACVAVVLVMYVFCLMIANKY